MERMMADCRRFSDNQCQLTIIGPEDEVGDVNVPTAAGVPSPWGRPWRFRDTRRLLGLDFGEHHEEPPHRVNGRGRGNRLLGVEMQPNRNERGQFAPINAPECLRAWVNGSSPGRSSPATWRRHRPLRAEILSAAR
jgi:hypothetical protein